MKVLVCLGTHSQDFSRLAKAIDELAATVDYEFVIQTGVTHYDFKHVQNHFDYCSKEKMNQYMDDADILVLQGGWGGIEEAIDKRKKIVAVPRREGLEHIHNQEQLVRKLDELGCVIGCFDERDLPTLIEKAKSFVVHPLKKGSATNIITNYLKEWF